MTASVTDPVAQRDRVFEGHRPGREGDFSLETQGMAPIPEDARYGSSHRNFWIWFGSNMNLSNVFTGTLAVALGLGLWPAIVAIVLGIAIGSLPVAWLSRLGPKTGMGILPLARLPFGKTIVAPALLQWFTTVAWDALIGIFGGQALQSLFGVPFVVGVVIILAAQGVAGFLGYEVIHRLEKWASVLTAVFFAIFLVKVVQRGDIATSGSLHGAAAVGAFVLMLAIAISSSISWAGCASDYSRYMARNSSSQRVFWYSMVGLMLSFDWLLILGVLAGKILTDQTADGVRTIMGSSALGDFALIAIAVGAVASNAIEDYSGSLALQAGGIRIHRHLVAILSTAVAFGLILWMHAGNTAGKFENILLFTGYWIAPFIAVVLVNWIGGGRELQPKQLVHLLDLDRLPINWQALVALAVGFGSMVPFMNTSVIVGPVASALHGADLSYPVGFCVGGLVYYALVRLTKVTPSNRSVFEDVNAQAAEVIN